MKKFGSNWKKLATNITSVRQKSSEVEEPISPSYGVKIEGNGTKTLFKTYLMIGNQ